MSAVNLPTCIWAGNWASVDPLKFHPDLWR